MLSDEIEKAQKLVKTDAYQLSISEIINMYRDGELVINPDFQRLFRWEIGQKSKLIESLLLGIPLPSIFVFERMDSKWELIDGLQRISTLLEFMGLLTDPDTGMPKSPSCLVATKYLPSLNNAVWEISDRVNGVPPEEQNALDSALQLQIRRARLSVEILKRPSDNSTKFELFQRLNAGGTQANPQELRNCIIIMVSNDYAKFVRSCAENGNFLSVLAATDDQLEKQRHMEYVSRFLVYTYFPYDNKLDVEEYIDEGIVKLATDGEVTKAAAIFSQTFSILNEAYGEDSLRRMSNGSHTGKVSLAAFECIAVGVAKNMENISQKVDPLGYVRERIEAFWKSEELGRFFSAGMRGTTRLQRTLPFGESWFSE